MYIYIIYTGGFFKHQSRMKWQTFDDSGDCWEGAFCWALSELVADENN